MRYADYILAGIRVSSPIDLVQLDPISSDGPAHDVSHEVRLTIKPAGTVPNIVLEKLGPERTDASTDGQAFGARGWTDTDFVFSLPEVFGWINLPEVIMWVRNPLITQAELRNCILDGVLPLIALALGKLPFHCASYCREGRAVLVAAPSGTGKSTLTAAMALDCGTVMADDWCTLERSGGEVMVTVCHPFVRLWGESVELLKIGTNRLIRTHSPKMTLDLREITRWVPGPVPLDEIIILQLEDDDQPMTEYDELPGKSKWTELVNFTLSGRALPSTMWLPIMSNIAHLAGNTRVSVVKYTQDLEGLSRLMHRIKGAGAVV